MMTHWAERIKRWNQIRPPMRPAAETVKNIQKLVAADQGPVMILGVTSELYQAFPQVHGYDREQVMIDNIWPGDTADKKVYLSDWKTQQVPEGKYAGVVGDGSLNMLLFPVEAALVLNRCMTWLKPGGTVAIRVFTRPVKTITAEQVQLVPELLNWDAFRCVLNMHIAGTSDVNIPSVQMLYHFDRLFPDRAKLAEQANWDLSHMCQTMDAYKGSQSMTSYPTRDQWLAVVPPDATHVQFVEETSYDLSKYFPILTFRKPV
jgi:hypothetical protein